MNPTPYERLGGADKLRELVDRFYDLMDSLPEAKGIRDMHPDDLSGSRDKLFMFLSGWFGGPSLYMEKFGHPRLRARHLPFVIGDAERDQWLLCMDKAMEEMELPRDLRWQLQQAFTQTANHMRNQNPIA